MEIVKKHQTKKKKTKRNSKKKQIGGYKGYRGVSKICENADKMVNPMNNNKTLELHLLDVVNCKIHYRNLHKKWIGKDKNAGLGYKRHSDRLLRKEQRLVFLLMNRGWNVPYWLSEFLG